MRLVLVLLLLARVAHADVGVVVSGDPVMQAPLMTHVQGWLQTHDYGLVAIPMGDAANTFIDCFVIEDMACAKRTFEQSSKATSIVFARADLMTGRDYTVVAYWFIRGHEPRLQKQQCKNCDDTQFAAIITTMLVELDKANANVKGKLKITSAVAGLMVSVDNASIGPAPLEHELAPGPHQVAFLHRGNVIDTRPVKIEPGATLELATPTPPPDPPPVKKKGSLALPISLVVTGAALAVAGGVFIYYGSLDGPDEPYVYTNAMKIGVPMSVAGAVGVIGGVVWAGTF
jgi:hypothetical protein